MKPYILSDERVRKFKATVEVTIYQQRSLNFNKYNAGNSTRLSRYTEEERQYFQFRYMLSYNIIRPMIVYILSNTPAYESSIHQIESRFYIDWHGKGVGILFKQMGDVVRNTTGQELALKLFYFISKCIAQTAAKIFRYAKYHSYYTYHRINDVDLNTYSVTDPYKKLVIQENRQDLINAIIHPDERINIRIDRDYYNLFVKYYLTTKFVKSYQVSTKIMAEVSVKRNPYSSKNKKTWRFFYDYVRYIIQKIVKIYGFDYDDMIIENNSLYPSIPAIIAEHYGITDYFDNQLHIAILAKGHTSTRTLEENLKKHEQRNRRTNTSMV